MGFLLGLIKGVPALLARLFGFLEARIVERQREADRAAGRAAQVAEQLRLERERITAANAARAAATGSAGTGELPDDGAADPFRRD